MAYYHLPIASNCIFKSMNKIKNRQKFKTWRTKGFSSKAPFPWKKQQPNSLSW